ncbi:MAG: FAD-dependent monooxygenase [Elusimicrobiota bacterium]|nr:FAD-dependent monooxygenase [Elusimicrobiota bacterium]
MNLPERCSVAIVGGGPAGSALAALLARAGRRPVLLERDRFPRQKLCGEFLSMEAQTLLARIGCLDAVRALCPAAITGARFFSPSGRSVEIDLGAEALGLGRVALDETLFRHAEQSGALAFEGAAVTRMDEDAGGVLLEIERSLPDGTCAKRHLRADRVVAAYGRRSGLDRPLDRDFLRRRSPFVGYKRRHVLLPGADPIAAELRGKVEIHLFDGGYCGVSVVDGGAVNVCLLAEQRVLATADASLRRNPAALLARLSPSLRGRIEALRPDGEPLAAAQLTFTAKETSSGSIFFIGDAAGMIAPLCGDGQAMALESAVLLAELMARGDGDDLPRLWDDLWRRRFASRLRAGRWLQALLMRPAASEAIVRILKRWPVMAAPLLTRTRGEPCLQP